MLGPSALIMPSSRTLLVPPPIPIPNLRLTRCYPPHLFPHLHTDPARLSFIATFCPPPSPPSRPQPTTQPYVLTCPPSPDARPSTPTSIHRRAAPTQGAQLFAQPGTVHPPPMCVRPLRFIMPSSTHTAYPPYRCHTSSPLTAYPRHAYSHTSNAPSPDSVGGVQRVGTRTV